MTSKGYPHQGKKIACRTDFTGKPIPNQIGGPRSGASKELPDNSGSDNEPPNVKILNGIC